ncbi:hypothetical protein [Melittangium boletus]|uniref:SRp25 nuclear protein, isoform 3 n=1 Tax=Melittangium boletus DSM 14713 TaxID=1294270 RepID=A0A250IG57_9BACT|nr:hypothetical protein [Melittangium boletus]ATB30238.1 SRp25 nuclear protein, isoform 3 [Melittangium boletus DSM 14713]
MQGRSTKRQKEMARQQKQRDKEARKEERQRDKEARPTRQPGEEDPDIAHIVPGPQPLPEGW